MSPLATNTSFLGVAKESTRGTGVTANIFVPVRSPAPHDIFNYYDDQAFKGSMVQTYSVVQGVGRHEYGFSGDWFPDVCPNVLMGLAGNSAAPVTGAQFVDVQTTNTVATITSNTANFSASDVGKTITGTGIPGATTILSVQSLTGATMSAAATATGVTTATIARTSTFTHVLGLLNNAASTANQPASYSLSDFNGNNTRQVTAAQFGEMNFSFQADGLLNYSARAVGNPSVIVSNPTNTPSTVLPQVGWGGQIIIGSGAGVPNLRLRSGTLNVKRTVNPYWTMTNSQNPARVFASDFTVDGALTFIVDDETEYNYYRTNAQPVVTLQFTQPTTQNVLRIQMSACALTDGSYQRGAEWLEVNATFRAMPNATDATATGQAPAKFSIINSQATQY